MPIKLAVLVSGRGSNLEAILTAIEDGRLFATVEIVLSNKAGVRALTIAKEHGVAAKAIESQGLPRRQHEQSVLDELNKQPLDLLVLAGYMRVLSAEFLSQFFDASTGLYRVINIHPSLLPDFPGANAYEDAFNAGVSESGITVHLVDEKVDHGPILGQARFPRLPQDSLADFQERGLKVEHQIFPAVLQRLAQKGLTSVAKEFVRQ